MRTVFFVRVAAAVVALFVASLISFPSFPGTGLFNVMPAISVNRLLKGDRLPHLDPTVRPHGIWSPALPPQSGPPRDKIPIGCDGAFSPISSPRLANVFRRCAV